MIITSSTCPTPHESLPHSPNLSPDLASPSDMNYTVQRAVHAGHQFDSSVYVDNPRLVVAEKPESCLFPSRHVVIRRVSGGGDDTLDEVDDPETIADEVVEGHEDYCGGCMVVLSGNLMDESAFFTSLNKRISLDFLRINYFENLSLLRSLH